MDARMHGGVDAWHGCTDARRRGCMAWMIEMAVHTRCGTWPRRSCCPSSTPTACPTSAGSPSRCQRQSNHRRTRRWRRNTATKHTTHNTQTETDNETVTHSELRHTNRRRHVPDPATACPARPRPCAPSQSSSRRWGSSARKRRCNNTVMRAAQVLCLRKGIQPHGRRCRDECACSYMRITTLERSARGCGREIDATQWAAPTD
jgi:hypothetical protein